MTIPSYYKTKLKIMKNPTYFIGIDVSKSTVDMTLILAGRPVHHVVKNTRPSIKKHLKMLLMKPY